MKLGASELNSGVWSILKYFENIDGHPHSPWVVEKSGITKFSLSSISQEGIAIVFPDIFQIKRKHWYWFTKPLNTSAISTTFSSTIYRSCLFSAQTINLTFVSVCWYLSHKTNINITQQVFTRKRKTFFGRSACLKKKNAFQ